MHARLLAALLALTAALAVALIPSGDRATAAASDDLMLPDLAQDLPRVLGVEPGDAGGWKLGFRSAVYNGGPGPMIIHATRPDEATPHMTAEQLIAREDGTVASNPGVGELEFVTNPTHRHWHLLGFERYELRRASDNRLVAPSSKTGFCLQDASTFEQETLPNKPSEPYFKGECGLEHPEALEVTEGISVGWIDVYDPFREGQDVPLTGAPAGRYMLVHRTNVEGKIRELDRTNDAATLLVELTWPEGRDGKPDVKTLRSCAASRQCYLKPPRLGRAQLKRYAATALHGARVSRCGPGDSRSGGCRVAWRGRRGKIAIRSILSAGVPYVDWSLRLGKRRDSGRLRGIGA